MFARTSKAPHAMPAIFACCALACALLGGCSQSFSSAAQALNDGVSADIAQLTDLDAQSAQTLFASDYTSALVAAGIDPVDVYGPMFSSLTYEVSAISVQDNTATVTVSISNKDLNQVFQSYTAAVTNELASSASRETLAAMDDNALMPVRCDRAPRAGHGGPHLCQERLHLAAPGLPGAGERASGRA